jgi:hypothetical protein
VRPHNLIKQRRLSLRRRPWIHLIKIGIKSLRRCKNPKSHHRRRQRRRRSKRRVKRRAKRSQRRRQRRRQRRSQKRWQVLMVIKHKMTNLKKKRKMTVKSLKKSQQT